jgi:hypothetical protein
MGSSARGFKLKLVLLGARGFHSLAMRLGVVGVGFSSTHDERNASFRGRA